MTEKDKKRFKKLGSSKDQKRFVAGIVEQQKKMGKFTHWLPAYQRKCKKKGADCVV